MDKFGYMPGCFFHKIGKVLFHRAQPAKPFFVVVVVALHRAYGPTDTYSSPHMMMNDG